MKCNSHDRWVTIVELSEGKPNTEAEKHIESCPECHVKFEQLKKMIRSMSLEHFVAPVQDVEWARNLMPEKVLQLTLLRTSIQLSGARSVNQDFQAVYGQEEFELRVMYSKVDSGWSIVSRLPEPNWNVFREGQLLTTDSEGHFQFETESLGNSHFHLRNSDVKFEVPSIGDTIDGSNRST